MKDQDYQPCKHNRRCANYNDIECNTRSYQAKCSVHDARKQMNDAFRQTRICLEGVLE